MSHADLQLPEMQSAQQASHCPLADSKHGAQVGKLPQDLQDRRVEITGPVDRKMVINALNSGSSVFMADFEDSNAPTWQAFSACCSQTSLIWSLIRLIMLWSSRACVGE